VDDRSRYFAKLRRLRRGARRWSVLAGGFAGAAAVLTPYHGLGVGDAGWAAAAGATTMLALWRWSDLRELAAQPAPPPPDPALVASRSRQRLEAMVARLPAGQAALDEVRRAQGRLKLRGTEVAALWARLDRASVTLAGMAGRLNGPAAGALHEAAAAERALRDLAERTASVERAMRVAPPDARGGLHHGHRELLGQLDDGVCAYERLVAAAAGYLAEDGMCSGAAGMRPVAEHPAVTRLTEATDLLRGVAAGLAELRTAYPGR
jgi:hypothetical protein